MNVGKVALFMIVSAACCAATINAKASSFSRSSEGFQVQVSSTVKPSTFPPIITGEDGAPIPDSIEVKGDAGTNQIRTLEAVVLESISSINGNEVSSDWDVKVSSYLLDSTNLDPGLIDIYIDGVKQDSIDNVSKLSLSVEAENQVLRAAQVINIKVEVTASIYIP
ncbi:MULTISPECIES: hypothetical protein [Vibrio]|uniref:hypothetical protein n=1 Tax=Vibrio TaxID=662 RepID=UPI00037C8BC8|nr:hypothetical protein [Vibrio crassostreae]OEE88935.1 hypothetical protein A140_18865 [Vibrio crassostreae 9ZC88]